MSEEAFSDIDKPLFYHRVCKSAWFGGEVGAPMPDNCPSCGDTISDND